MSSAERTMKAWSERVVEGVGCESRRNRIF